MAPAPDPTPVGPGTPAAPGPRRVHGGLGGLHARAWGPPDAPVLLLVHGLTDDGGCWPDAVDRWAGEWRVVAVDLPGHGRSPRLSADEVDDPMPVAARAVGRALHALADAHGRPAVGVGHSMGAGALALSVADGAPAAALVLEDPRIAHESTPVRARMGRMRAREVALWHDDPAGQLARLRADCPGWSNAEVEACASARSRTDTALLATGRAGLVGGDGLQAACVDTAAAAAPTLLVTGDRTGAIWTPERLAMLTGTARVAVVPGGGHTVRRDVPDDYHAAVDPFLAAHR